MKKLLTYLSLLLFVPSSCQQSGKDSKPQNVLRINFQDGDLPSTHPHIGIDYRMRSLQSALFEGLIRLDVDGNPQPAAAESVVISESQTLYTFSMRSAKWSNGKEVTAQQFANAWKAAIAKGSPCRRPDLFYVIKNAEKIKKGELSLNEAGIRAIDDHTLEVELEHPAPYFLELISNPIFSPLYDASDEPSVYNGPFVIDKWKYDQIIVLKKNPRYWDEKSVELDRLEISVITDSLTALHLFEKGLLDWVGSPFSCLPADIIPSYLQTGELKTKEVARVYWIYCNSVVPPFTNSSIRKALALAINRKALVDHVLLGQTASAVPLPSCLSLVSDLSKGQEAVLAKQYFTQGLEELNLTPSTFPPIKLSYSHIEGQKQLAEIIQSHWQKVLGVKVQIEGSEWNVFFDNLSRGEFQVGGCIKSALFKDPIYHLELLQDKNHPYNVCRWESPDYQKLLEQAHNEIDLEKRNSYLRQAEEILVEQMPVIPVYSEVYLYMLQPHIKDVVIHDLGHVDFKWTKIDMKINTTSDRPL